MDCSEIKDKLQSYIEGEEDHPDVREHIEDCPDCRKELSAYRDLISDLNNLKEVRVTGDFTRRVMNSLKAKEKEGIKTVIIAAAVMFVMSFAALGFGLRNFFSDPGSFVKMPVITKNILAGSITVLTFTVKALISIQNFALMALGKLIMIGEGIPPAVWFVVPLALFLIDAFIYRLAVRKEV